MKTDSDSLKKIMLLIIILLAALLCFVINAKTGGNVIAQTHDDPEMDMRVQLLQEQVDCKLLRETVHAYNKVLHRIWIDKPAYVEDVLNEYDEYCDLSNLLTPEDEKEIYTFYDERDSIDYHLNIDLMDCILGDPGCDLPVHTKKTLDEIFHE